VSHPTKRRTKTPRKYLLDNLLGKKNTTSHGLQSTRLYNPRFLAIRTPADAQRELNALGIDPDKGKALGSESFNYYLKVESLDPETLRIFRDRVRGLGGKVISSGERSREKGNAEALIVGNLPFLKTLTSQTKPDSGNLQVLIQELRTAVGSLSDNGNLIVEWNGRKIDFSSRTYIMGIVNVTPDSFADAGRFFDPKKTVAHALTMAEDGVDIIDIGGESTRPGAQPVDEKEELRRVIPVIKRVVKEVNVIVSIDTTKAHVAEAALSEGAQMVNDVSALRFDPDLAALVALKNVPVVLMHMRGTPQTMQKNVHYRDLISEITRFLRERIAFAVQCGIDRKKIIIDPGIGFGKSVARDNFTILRNLEEFKSLGRPLLIGPSRKAFLGHLLNLPAADRDEATAGAVAVAIMNGAHIVRVHDVKKMQRVVKVVDTIKKSAPLHGAEQEN